MSESTEFDSFKLNSTLSNLRQNSQKFDLGSTFYLEVAFHICRILCINYRNPYPYWIKNFSRDWEYLQQTVLRWLDTVFQGQYLPSLSANYVAINKDLEKLTPQLY